MKVCAEPGCPAIQREGRCLEHRRQREQARGTRQQRGYDAGYDQQRRDWQRRLDQGERVTCWRCDELGKPHDVDPTDWHLGHSNTDRSVVRGPQCSASNLDTSISSMR